MPAHPDRQQTGAAAEAAARATLEAQGLRTLASNVNFRFGELDLVMRDGDTVVFVEVRYRRNDRFGGGAGSVDHRKRRRIVLAARAWLAGQRGLADAPCRFDVVTAQGEPPECEWIRGAFTLEDV
ncbi:MAG: YraN family protein [Lysobacteraceae bacterium]|nr:MAG: YraN family protein [Xanthomonadaceae bacterium]